MPEVMKTVGRYEILREVGRGGMAMVYLARQTDLDRFVALKELGAFHASDPSFAQRFLRESRVAGLAVAPEHRHRARLLRARRHAVHRDGVRRARLAAPVRRPDDAGADRRRARGPARRAHPRRGARHRAPRPQAREPDGHGRRAREDRRLRHRQGDHEDADGRVPDRDRHDRRHADLHGARAGDGAGHRPVDRPLLGRLHGVRAVHGQRPVPRLRRADGDPAAPRQRADRAGQVDPPRGRPAHLGLDRARCWSRSRPPRTQNAQDAWDDFEEILLGLLGPRWRREARLVERAHRTTNGGGAKPLTPAPFQGTQRRRRRLRGVQVLRLGRARPDTGAVRPRRRCTRRRRRSRRRRSPSRSSARRRRCPRRPIPAPLRRADRRADRRVTGFVTFGAPAPPPPTDALLARPRPSRCRPRRARADAGRADARPSTEPRVRDLRRAAAARGRRRRRAARVDAAPPPSRPPTVAPRPPPRRRRRARRRRHAGAASRAAAAAPASVAGHDDAAARCRSRRRRRRSRRSAAEAGDGASRPSGSSPRRSPAASPSSAIIAASRSAAAAASRDAARPRRRRRAATPGAGGPISRQRASRCRCPAGWTGRAATRRGPRLRRRRRDRWAARRAARSCSARPTRPPPTRRCWPDDLRGGDARRTAPDGRHRRRRPGAALRRAAGRRARPRRVFAVPTTEGVATLACFAEDETCDDDRLVAADHRGQAFPVGPSDELRRGRRDARWPSSRSPRSRRPPTLATAGKRATPGRRDRASSRRLQRRRDARSRKLDVSPADALLNAQLVAALRAAGARLQEGRGRGQREGPRRLQARRAAARSPPRANEDGARRPANGGLRAARRPSTTRARAHRACRRSRRTSRRPQARRPAAASSTPSPPPSHDARRPPTPQTQPQTTGRSTQHARRSATAHAAGGNDGAGGGGNGGGVSGGGERQRHRRRRGRARPARSGRRGERAYGAATRR